MRVKKVAISKALLFAAFVVACLALVFLLLEALWVIFMGVA